jgi:hypothetical protein
MLGLTPLATVPLMSVPLYSDDSWMLSDSSERFTLSSISDGHTPRPPLSEKEAEVVTALKGAFKSTNPGYCCAGHVPLSVKRPMVFYSTAPAIFATDEKQARNPISAGYISSIRFDVANNLLDAI